MSRYNLGVGSTTTIERYDVEQQIKDDEAALKKEFRGGLEFGCCRCGEAYKALKDDTVEEIRALQRWLAQGNCPYCGNKEGNVAYYGRLRRNNMHLSNIPHNFTCNGKDYFVLRLGRK